MITGLITQTDSTLLVRDRIAQIIADESASQQAMAPDPAPYKLRVYTERSDVWAFMQTADGGPPQDRPPVVSVSFDKWTDNPRSSTLTRQNVEAFFSIDVYGVGAPSAEGQVPVVTADESSSREAQRSAALVRHVLMSDIYANLGFAPSEGIVGGRMVRSIESFQLENTNQTAFRVSAVRLVLGVTINEYSSSNLGEILSTVSTITKGPDGAVLAAADFEGLDNGN